MFHLLWGPFCAQLRFYPNLWALFHSKHLVTLIKIKRKLKKISYRQVVTHVTLVDERDGAVSDGAAGKLLALA